MWQVHGADPGGHGRERGAGRPLSREGSEPPTPNLQPSTLNPQPSTLNPQPSTLNPQPSILSSQPSTPTLKSQPFLCGCAALLSPRTLSVRSPVDPSFRALSGRLKFTVRRHGFNKDFVSVIRAPTSRRRETMAAPRCSTRLRRASARCAVYMSCSFTFVCVYIYVYTFMCVHVHVTVQGRCALYMSCSMSSYMCTYMC